jgi:hypothetical protein
VLHGIFHILHVRGIRGAKSHGFMGKCHGKHVDLP